MGQIKSSYRTDLMSCLGDSLDVKKLPRVILDSSHIDHGKGGALLAYLFDNIFGAQGKLPCSWQQFDQHVIGIETMKLDLSFQHVLVRRKGSAFYYDFKSSRSGLVKGNHQKVQIDRKVVHGNHLLGQGTQDLSQNGL